MGSERSLLLIALIVPAACAEPDFDTQDEAIIEGPGPRKKEPPRSDTQKAPAPTPAPSGGSGASTADDAKGCDPTLPFAKQEVVVGAPDDDTGYGVPRLSGDELRAYYSSASGNLFRTERASKGSAFSSGSQVMTFASAWQPTVTNDELTLVFSRGDQNEQLWIATRTSLAAPFGTPVALGGGVNSSSRAQIDPYLRGDGKELFFHRYNPGNSGDRGDIYVAAISGSSAAQAQLVANINSPADDRYPVVTADGLTIFWGSDRTDLGGKGRTDIYVATRPSVTAAFTGVKNVTELASAEDERPAWVSPDGCRLYFQKGNSLLVARRPAK
ncbi:MAG: PD40 domain-containing protein [Deltaproteobacteria bacterium]|nr:PD40 domain-containing protein [Deltaproteobacteria bacterium]